MQYVCIMYTVYKVMKMRLKVHNCFILLFPYNYYFVYIQLLFVVFKNVISFTLPST